MQYKRTSWSLGEPFNAEKLRQMAENDEVIHKTYLQTALGIIEEGVYIDHDGTLITCAPGDWETIITLPDVFIYPSRWLKISAILNYVGSGARGTYIPARVTMDGNEILYMRTPDAFLTTQKFSTLSGARIMAAVPGVHDFVLEIGNDYASSVNDTYLSPNGADNPTILSISDIGGTYV